MFKKASEAITLYCGYWMKLQFIMSKIRIELYRSNPHQWFCVRRDQQKLIIYEIRIT